MLQYQTAFQNFSFEPNDPNTPTGRKWYSPTNWFVWRMAQLEKWKLIAFPNFIYFYKVKERVVKLMKSSEKAQEREVPVCNSFHLDSVPRSHKMAGEKPLSTAIFWPAQTCSVHIYLHTSRIHTELTNSLILKENKPMKLSLPRMSKEI